MKKKTKLIGAVFALCTSLCMLCFGVMAASSVSLNVSSTVSFSAQGVYLKAQGQVKRGANTGSLSNLVGDTYSYTGYSYNPDENGAPDGTVYTQTAMRDDAGSTSGWNIGEVEFTENEKVLQYEIVFTNYSEFDVEITITPTTAGTLTNVTTSSQTAEKVTVSAKSGQTPGTKTYTFTMTLNNVATSQSGTVGLDISAVKYEEKIYNVTVNITGTGTSWQYLISASADSKTEDYDDYITDNNIYQVKDYLYFDFCNTSSVINYINIKYSIDNGEDIQIFNESGGEGWAGIEEPGKYVYMFNINKECIINITASYECMGKNEEYIIALTINKQDI